MEYTEQKECELNIAGLVRKLPIVEIEKGKLWIASFVMLGDTELNYRCAQELSNRFTAENFDYIVVPEAKALPLSQALGQIRNKSCIVLRKSAKAYMQEPLIVDVESITTKGLQKMVMNGSDAEKIRGKGVVLLDDVVSTGGSYRAMVHLVKKAGAHIKFGAAVLREGNFDIKDIEEETGKIIFLEDLPVFEI